jgi:hypothetical protein
MIYIYHICVRISQELCHRIEYVPHGRSADTYRQILDGGDLPPLLLPLGDLRPDLDTNSAKGMPRQKKPRTRGPSGAPPEMLPIEDVSPAEPGFADEDFDLELELEKWLLAESDDDGRVGAPEGVAGAHGADADGRALSGGTGSAGDGLPAMPAAGDVGPVGDAIDVPAGHDRIAHNDYLCDIRGDGVAILKHLAATPARAGKLWAHCRYASHGPMCRMGRVLKPNTGTPAQGRPGGLLIAWIDCASDFTSAPDHMAINRQPHVFLDPRLGLDKRERARSWSQREAPQVDTLLKAVERERRPGEGLEPSDPH